MFVRTPGLEPGTFAMSMQRSSQLSYARSDHEDASRGTVILSQIFVFCESDFFQRSRTSFFEKTLNQ